MLLRYDASIRYDYGMDTSLIVAQKEHAPIKSSAELSSGDESSTSHSHAAGGTLDYDAYAIEVLREHGLRITEPRQRIIQLLGQTTRPVSAYDIKDLLDADTSHKKADVVSIYRVLECLEANHLVHRLLSSGKVVRCQLSQEEEQCTREGHYHCHHVLVCQQCHEVSEVHCVGVEAMIKTLEDDTQFNINHHFLEFTGVCMSCQKK